jgi:CubicO group peptidase (beta-lactamase class C family)
LKTWPLILVLFSLFSILAQAQSLNDNSSPVSPANDIQILTDSIDKMMKHYKIVGGMVGIIRSDTILFCGGFGYEDIRNKIEVNDNTLFRLGSVTKMFVGLGILKLIEDGKLKAEDKISEVAPEIPYQNPYEATHPLKIIHLLEHTSGFDDIKLNRMYSYEKTSDNGLSMMMIHAPSMVCRWRPGERTAYSNPNYAALGFIIEKITGKRYDEFLREQILMPLNMNMSNFNLGSILEENTKEYKISGSEIEEVPSVYLKSGPQGALWSNSREMVLFLQLLIQKGKPVVSEKSFEIFETSQSSLAARSGLLAGYAMGNSSAFPFAKSSNWRGHDGITGTCFSGCYYNSELRSGFIISLNSNQSIDPISQSVVSFLEKDYHESELATVLLNKEIISPYLGYYEFQSPRNEISAFIDQFANTQNVVISHDSLLLKTISGNTSKLLPTSSLQFTWPGMNKPLVVFTNRNDVMVMCIGGTYYEKIPFSKVITKKIIVCVVLFFLLNGFVLFLFSFIQYFRRRYVLHQTVVNSLPAVACVFLMLAFHQLFHIKEFSYLLADLNSPGTRSVTIFAGTIMFAVLSIVAGYFAAKRLITKMNFSNWYYALIVVSLMITTLFLSINGIVGLRSWAM